MNEMTEESAYLQLTSLCAKSEHCQHEMLEKMRKWEMTDEAASHVMARLLNERYVDDERFTRAFVKDKIRYNGWGRRKVEQALWMKHIDKDIRKNVLDEVDDEEYLDVLRPLLKQKSHSVKARNNWEMNQKLVKFALQRGFTYDLIRQCLDGDVGEMDEEP